jgi:predicted ATPase
MADGKRGAVLSNPADVMTEIAPARPVPFVTRVRVADFRSIASCDVSLGPLTVLLGFNAVSRSAIVSSGALETVVAAVAERVSSTDSCKGWLSARRTDGRTYKPSSDQAALAAVFDLRMARENSASFDKLWRDLERLLTSRQTAEPPGSP